MKVLLVYPCDNGVGQIPIGLSMIQACLRQAGHETRIFDTTFYRQRDRHAFFAQLGVHKPTDLEAHGVRMIDADIDEEFVRAVEGFGPDLIGITCASYGFKLAAGLMAALRGRGNLTPVLIGGAHPTVAPDRTIAHEHVDMICVGEGEEAIVELCDRLSSGRDITNIPNIWVKQGGRVHRNDVRPFADMNRLPCPDTGGFSEMHLYKPFVGQVYRCGHVEISRGCIYSCAYCINAHVRDLYEGKGTYHREKSIDKAISDIRTLVERDRLEMLRFWDETFLCMSRDRLQEFARRYRSEIGLPLLVSTHPATMTADRVELLREMGCIAVSIGIETGCERLRREVLNRKATNEQIVRAFAVAREAGLRATAFNMIGLPGETRAEIFETIRLNRAVRPDTTGANFVYPYEGTRLRKSCLEAGYIRDDVRVVDHNCETVLEMPQITRRELDGLLKTFHLYVQSPRWAFPLVRLCEADNAASNWLFRRMIRRFC